MKKNILQFIGIVLAGFLVAFISEAAPRYKIDSGSDMTAPPAIGAATPSTGRFTGGTFDFIGVTHMSLTGMLSTAALRVGDSRAGDMLGFIGEGQSSLVKSGPTGYVLKSGGVGVMPRWEVESGGGGSPDWANPGTIGSTTPNTIKGTTINSTTGLSVAAGGITSTETVAAGGSGIIGYADSGAAIASGDRLGYYLLGGAKDAAHTLNNSAGVSAYATQNWSGSAAGTKLQFEVTPNGSTTRSVAMTINQDGTVTTATPLNQSTTGNAATATALTANPTDCSAGQYATAIAASGDLTCAALPAATSSVMGYRSTNQNIDRTTNTKVLFNAEEHDAGNEFDLSTGRFTATNAGTYLIAGCGYMVAIEVGKLFNVQLFKNGALLTNVLTYGSSADNHSICTSIVRSLAVSDYIEMWVYHNNAATPRVLSGAATGGIDTHISIQRLY